LRPMNGCNFSLPRLIVLATKTPDPNGIKYLSA
jgi:hypothetical protein